MAGVFLFSLFLGGVIDEVVLTFVNFHYLYILYYVLVLVLVHQEENVYCNYSLYLLFY